MIFLSLRVTADAEGGLKNRAHLRPVLQGFGGGQPPTSTRQVYTGALLAATQPLTFYRLQFPLFIMVASWDFAALAVSRSESAVITSLMFWGFLISHKFFRKRG